MFDEERNRKHEESKLATLKGYGLNLVKKDDKIGFEDEEGKLVIPCEYDAYEIKGKTFMVYKNSKGAVYNRNTGELSDLDYDWEEHKPYGIVVYKGAYYHYCGLYNNMGQKVLNCEYIDLDFYDEKAGLVAVQSSGWKYMSLHTNEVFEHDSVVDYTLKSGFKVVHVKDKYMLVEPDGHPVSDWCDSYEVNEKYVLMKKNDGKKFIFNSKGKFLEDFKRSSIIVDIDSEIVINETKDRDSIYHITEESVKGLYSSWKDIPETSLQYYHGTNFICHKQTNKFLGFSGDVDFSEGLMPIRNMNRKWGYVNELGEIVIPFQFDECPSGFYKGFAMAKKDGKYGVIDAEGKEITGYIYDDYKLLTDGYTAKREKAPCGDYIIVTKNNQVGLINPLGETVVELGKFESFNSPFLHLDGDKSYELIYVRKDGKTGLIDKQGNIVFDFKYDKLYLDNEIGFFYVHNNGKQGLVDLNFNEIIPCEYDTIESVSFKFEPGFAAAKKGKIWGILDIEENKFIPYENTDSFFYDYTPDIIQCMYFERVLESLTKEFWETKVDPIEDKRTSSRNFFGLKDIDSIVIIMNAILAKRLSKANRDEEKIQEITENYEKIMELVVAKRIQTIKKMFGIKRNPLSDAQQDFNNLVKPTGSLVDPK